MLNTYARNPVLFTRAKACSCDDENGTEYLDLLSGIGVCALGYNHPAIDSGDQRAGAAALPYEQPVLSPAHGRARAAADRDHAASIASSSATPAARPGKLR